MISFRSGMRGQRGQTDKLPPCAPELQSRLENYDIDDQARYLLGQMRSQILPLFDPIFDRIKAGPSNFKLPYSRSDGLSTGKTLDGSRRCSRCPALRSIHQRLPELLSRHSTARNGA